MPEKTVKRRLQDCDAALAADYGPIFSTVARLVEALKRSIPEGTQHAERTKIEWVRLTRCAIASRAKPDSAANLARKRVALGSGPWNRSCCMTLRLSNTVNRRFGQVSRP